MNHTRRQCALQGNGYEQAWGLIRFKAVMNNQPPQTYTRVAVAIVVAGIVIAAAILVPLRGGITITETTTIAASAATSTAGTGVTSVTTASSSRVTSTSSSLNYTYDSDINSSNICYYSNATATSIISNIENYPAFKFLEGNHTYALDGYGCQTAPNKFPTVTFIAYDLAHPVSYQCQDISHTFTTYPSYEIGVDLQVTATGYDLAQSTYTLRANTIFEGCPAG